MKNKSEIMMIPTKIIAVDFEILFLIKNQSNPKANKTRNPDRNKSAE